MKKKKENSSPCVSVCTIEEETGFCRGCYRTLAEIAGWPKFTDEKRVEMLRELDQRRLHHPVSHPYSI